MLSAPEFPLFRLQNSNFVDSVEKEDGLPAHCEFLPANFYPIQTPGFTAHWSVDEVSVMERNDETARTLFQIKAADLPINSGIFDKRRRGERKSQKAKNNSLGVFNWLKSSFSFSSHSHEDQVKIVTVVPLMFDSTVFDALIVIERTSDGCVGFIRVRQLMTGADFRDLQRFDGFIPAVDMQKFGDDKSGRIAVWKSFLLIAGEREFKWISLSQFDESDWMSTEINVPDDFDKFIACSDRNDEKAFILVKTKKQVYGYFKIEKENSSFEYREFHYNVDDLIGGYIGDCDDFMLFDHENVIKIARDHTIKSQSLCIEHKRTDLIYLVPWRKDLKVSSLLIQLKHKDGLYQIVVVALPAGSLKTEILLQSDWFTAKGEIKKIFVSSCLEIYLLCRNGNVEIFEGLLLASDWSWLRGEMRQNANKSFEFSKWFNIFGEFPFEKKKCQGLLIDELLKESGISESAFPPEDWKSLGWLCEKLKEANKIELVLYLLFAARAHPAKLAQFYSQYGITDKQVAFMEAAFYIDNGQFDGAVKTVCTRKMRENDKNFIAGRLVKMCTSDEELARFSLFAAGRLISLDVLLYESPLLPRMIESILKTRGVCVVMEWLKGMFAWLRPDDRCALIPVANLHRQLMGQFLQCLLGFDGSARFKQLGMELAAYAASLEDVEMVKLLIGQLRSEYEKGGSEGRAAWLLTMICASRELLYPLLLEFDFDRLEDEDLRGGIERIREIVRPLASKRESIDLRLIDTEVEGVNESTSNISFISSPRTPIKSTNNLIKIYEKSPRASEISLNTLAGVPRSPSFVPRHFPPKKPTSLSSTLAADRSHQTSQKRSRLEEMQIPSIPSNSSCSSLNVPPFIPSKEDVGEIVMLTKEKDERVFESVLTEEQFENKKSTKRRRRK